MRISERSTTNGAIAIPISNISIHIPRTHLRARPPPRRDIRPVLYRAHLALPFPLPCLRPPTARSETRLVRWRRDPFAVCTSRHGHQPRGRLHRNRQRRRPRCCRGNQSRRRLHLDVSCTRCQTCIHARHTLVSLNSLSHRPAAHRNRLCHELIHQLVQACLPAQMFRSRTQPIAREPSANPQLSTLLVCHKPVVRLLLFRSADVARYCLPDH